MADSYTGGCHCGAVRFRTTAKLDKLMSCNCSICSKTGTLLAIAAKDQFELLSGADALSDYQFGKKRVHHLFCSRCGVRSFGRGTMPDGREVYAVNARCLDDLDLAGIPVQQHDGRSIPLD